MPWDSDKSTAADPDNPQADEQLTADEWDNHVSEGHFPGDELNFGVDGNGDPVITDPQSGGQTVMRYDRSKGSWVVDALEATSGSLDGDELIGFPSSSQSTSVTLGVSSWTTINASRPGIFLVRVSAVTDGSTRGLVQVAVDESGNGGPNDYKLPAALAPTAGGSGFVTDETAVIPLVAGAQVKIENTDDPNGSNSVATQRFFEF